MKAIKPGWNAKGKRKRLKAKSVGTLKNKATNKGGCM